MNLNSYTNYSCCEKKENKTLSLQQQKLDQEIMLACLNTLTRPIIKNNKRQEEVPISACIYHHEQGIIAYASNSPINDNNPCAHAEILAIGKACKALGNYRLTKCSIYITLEPCMMCLSAILSARLERIIFACLDNKIGLLSKGRHSDLHSFSNHHFFWTPKVCLDQSEKILNNFFASKR